MTIIESSMLRMSNIPVKFSEDFQMEWVNGADCSSSHSYNVLYNGLTESLWNLLYKATYEAQIFNLPEAVYIL